MANGSKKPKQVRPWDRRPWPISGNADQETLYAAVGRALSEWERYEAALSFLFANFIGAPVLIGAMRAYSAVRTFEGRAEMLRAASEAYFYGHGSRADHLRDGLKAVIRDAACFSARRNDIAHGVVDHYRPEPPTAAPIPAENTFALFPAYSTFKERDLEGVPTYCLTANELEYFRQQFAFLRVPLRALSAEVEQVHRAPVASDKLRAIVRRSISRKADQNDEK